MSWLDRFREPPYRDEHMVLRDQLLSTRDPMRSYIKGRHKRRPLIGHAAVSEETNILTVASPRQLKTSAIMIPNVLGANGPVWTNSTKPDIAEETALWRSRLGRLWWYDPSSDSETPPGFTRLRWSPVKGSEDWAMARQAASTMTATAGLVNRGQAAGKDGSSYFWDMLAAEIIACALHAAALEGEPMSVVVRWCTRFDQVQLGDTVGKILERHDATVAEGMIRKFTEFDSRTWSSASATVLTTLRPYLVTNVTDLADRANFHPEHFVTTRDTVYVVVPSYDQGQLAALISSPAAQVARATYRQYRKNRQANPTTFVLDEMYGSPLPDLPIMTSEGGSQNLITIGALQGMTQAIARWGEVAPSLFNTFGNVVLGKGMRELDAVHRIFSALAGEYDVEMIAQSHSFTKTGLIGGSGTTGWSTQWQRVPKIPLDHLEAGLPGRPDTYVMAHAGGGIDWVDIVPYWRSPFWVPLLIANMMNCVKEGVGGKLPIPDLMRDGNPQAIYDAAGWDWVKAFEECRNRLAGFPEDRQDPNRYTLGDD